MARKRKASPAKDADLTTGEAKRISKKRNSSSEPEASGSGGRIEESLEKKLPIAVSRGKLKEEDEDLDSARFSGEPVAADEARRCWPQRYDNTQLAVTQARHHYKQAKVDGEIYNLEDDAFVEPEPGKKPYICKIIELFQAVDGTLQFTAQWYYRAEDTVIQQCNDLIDEHCIFFSEVKDDNPLDCLIKKLKIERRPSWKLRSHVKVELEQDSDFYSDKMYLLPYTSFVNLPSDNATDSSASSSTISSETEADGVPCNFSEVQPQNNETTLLDLYSGCGGMSTGLCQGANIGGVKLVTKWAVDLSPHACESLKLNHPETEVRNEKAEDFLSLLKEWEKLCTSYLSPEGSGIGSETENGNEIEDEEDDDANVDDSEVYEVDEILSICYGDPKSMGKSDLYFKIRWLGYGPDEDTWEGIEGLSSCKEKLKDFVARGYKSKILPLPGSVDVLCGGPPCQGVSGFNRFRNKEKPLDDEKNRQLLVYMDIVKYLRPRFVLMENVVDILRFSSAFIGRYAIGSLVGMGYQARMGMMVAGSYGLPQYRMRVFLWGALPNERLPQYPLPTHNVLNRGNPPKEFEANQVTFEEGHHVELKDMLFLRDAITDLPNVNNDEARDEIPYDSEPLTEFQRFIRLQKNEMPGMPINSESVPHNLFDHRPLELNKDDYERVCAIPKRKGANFRDLPGVRVRADKKVEWDPDIERKLLSSGSPLVPDYAMTFVDGKSLKPFGRLWWDETVSTVVTRAEPHNQAILHPLQDRVLTVRENARLQGFPDYYKLCGPIKERYIQVGNAVAVPVGRALGYSLALALNGLSGEKPSFSLPDDFPSIMDASSPSLL